MICAEAPLPSVVRSRRPALCAMQQAQNHDSGRLDAINKQVRRPGYDAFACAPHAPGPASAREICEPRHRSFDRIAHLDRRPGITLCDVGKLAF